MTDQPPGQQAGGASAPAPKHPTDWPTLIGVAAIPAIAVAALFLSPMSADKIALAAIAALAGWLGHKAVDKVTGQ